LEQLAQTEFNPIGVRAVVLQGQTNGLFDQGGWVLAVQLDA
jgi:hypothetical protein